MFLSFPDLVEDPFGIAPDYYANVRSLSESGTNDYVAHRLRLAGNRGQTVFTCEALALVYRVSCGNPRRIDEVCSVAMKCAFANNETVVSRGSVAMAADRIEDIELNASDLTDVDRVGSIRESAPANQDWLEVTREFGVQNQIIDRLRDEANVRSRELEELHAQVAGLTQARSDWQQESAAQEERQLALLSMEAKIEQLQALYDDVSSENVRLAEKLKKIAERDETEKPGDSAGGDACIGLQDAAEPETSPQTDPRPRLTVVAVESGRAQGEVILNDERLLLPMDPRTTKSYRIRAGRLGLGSKLDNDFPIKSRFVSPHHARIDSDDNNSVLVDLNSTNGTFVNGKRITRRALRDGDDILIGKSKFQFVRQLVERSTTKSTLAGPGSGDNLSTSRFSAHRYKPLLP